MARDPYKYFRVEAREIVEGLARAALELEKANGGREPVVHMLRLAHTLKGAARVVRQAQIAEIAHAIEELLSPHRDPGSSAGAGAVADPILRMLDDMSALVGALEPQTALVVEKTAPATPESARSVRIEIAEMDALLEGISEAALRISELRRELEDLSRAHSAAAALVDQLPAANRARASAEEVRGVVARAHRNLGAGIDAVDGEIGQIRDRAHDLRLLPASVVFPTLERAVRDVAHTLDRAVAFDATGGDCRLEANVLFAVRDALLHVVRNAVTHGIEPAAERRRLGKSNPGRIGLRVERRGGRVAFVCSDDGRGVDVESVRRVAVERGATTRAKADAMGSEEILRLVLESGVSTTQTVTELSGRGVGLDVLRATIAALKGEVTLGTRPGIGTTIDLCVPVSISSITALVLEVGAATFAMPLDAVAQSLRLTAGDVARLGDYDSVVVDGAAVPFLPLARLVRGSPQSDRADRAWSAVIVTSGAQRAVVGADRLVGTSNIVLRPLPKAAGPVPIASGVSLDSAGNPQLVLDPRGLVTAAHDGRAKTYIADAVAARAPILVVDDSLTTRMLEQSILESAGYAVALATSGEEALVRARDGAHSLFLVDVEMSGMDGFEFVSRAAADASLRDVPAIMVTSCDSVVDRQRAREVGARAYIVKGEFDQSQFLRTIRQLIG